MPVQTSYPGVYIQEKSSGVRAITGVPTSITAFVGAAPRGPVDTPVRLGSFAEFARTFGTKETTLNVAVSNYFDNGGGDAIVVRVTNIPSTATDEGKSTGTWNGLILRAKAPGTFGDKIKFRVKDSAISTNEFSLTVFDSDSGARETFNGIDITAPATSPKSIQRILQSSQLVEAKTVPTTRPAQHNDRSDGKDPFDESPVATTGGGTGGTAASAATQPVYFTALSGGNDGAALVADSFKSATVRTKQGGIYALEKADIFNILCIPPLTVPTTSSDTSGDIAGDVWAAAAELCLDRRAMLLVDVAHDFSIAAPTNPLSTVISKAAARNAAVYFPRVKLLGAPDPEGRYSPLGIVAGTYARTDAERGVWKAPAGIDTAMGGVAELATKLNDNQQGRLNPIAINCLRTFPAAGNVVWGARTLSGVDDLADTDNKYVPVRRLTLFIEESLYRGTQWVVFEPNDEPLWAQIRLNVGSFMNQLFRQGALQGRTPTEAYLVKCDKETTTQADINNGVVNILVAFAPLKPAEFVIITIQQLAGQLAV